MNYARGFTLIEVLLALAVIAIALTALLKAASQNVAYTDRLKEKSLQHWIAMNAVRTIQLGMVNLITNQESTQTTKMGGKTWYWRAIVSSTPVSHMQQIQIRVSQYEDKDFSAPLIAFRYVK